MVRNLFLTAVCLWSAVVARAAGEACLLSIDRSTSKVLSESVDEADETQLAAVLEAMAAISRDNSLDANAEEEAREAQSQPTPATTADAELAEVPETLSKLLCPFKEAATAAKFFAVEANLTAEKELPHARRCALVSNSGVLLHHSYGEAIDAADLVFRFNDAEIGGSFAEHVGSRDDIRVLNRLVGNKIVDGTFPVSEGVLYLFARHRQPEDSFLHDYFVTANGSTHLSQILIGTGELERVTHDILANDEFKRFNPGPVGVPSTGFLGLTLAMTLCQEVHTYGFLASHAAFHAPFHYFGALKQGNAVADQRHAGHHGSVNEERRIFQRASLNDHPDQSDIAIIPGFAGLPLC